MGCATGGQFNKLLQEQFTSVAVVSGSKNNNYTTGADLGGGCRGCAPPPDLRFSNTTGTLQKKKKTMRFIGVEVDKRRVHPLLKKILDPPLHL